MFFVHELVSHVQLDYVRYLKFYAVSFIAQTAMGRPSVHSLENCKQYLMYCSKVSHWLYSDFQISLQYLASHGQSPFGCFCRKNGNVIYSLKKYLVLQLKLVQIANPLHAECSCLIHGPIASKEEECKSKENELKWVVFRMWVVQQIQPFLFAVEVVANSLIPYYIGCNFSESGVLRHSIGQFQKMF